MRDSIVDNHPKSYFFLSDDSEAPKADAILFDLHRTKSPNDLKPAQTVRNKNQIWVWLTDEGLFHTFWGGDTKLRLLLCLIEEL